MEEVVPFVDESLWRIIQTIHYDDALVEQLPQERSLYEEIATRLLSSFQYERAMVYMDLMAERFPEVRAETLRLLAGVQRKYSDTCYEEGDDERALRFIELAKENLRQSLAIENTFAAHVVLAELLTEDMEDHLNEAEEHLREAKELSSGPVDEANVEIYLVGLISNASKTKTLCTTINVRQNWSQTLPRPGSTSRMPMISSKMLRRL